MTNVGMDRRVLVRGHGRSSLWHSVDYRMVCAPRHGIPTHRCQRALHANEIEVENDVMYPTYLALERYALRPLLESPPA